MKIRGYNKDKKVIL